MPTFQMLGRSQQLRLTTAADLDDALALDDALWVATAAPIDTFLLDRVFLDAVDDDDDGRVRADELRGAIRWMLATLTDKAAISEGRDVLDLSAIEPASADGPKILDSAKRMLGELGTPTAGAIRLDQVRSVRAAEEARGLSTAGKVLPAAAGDDAALARFLDHVLEATGGEAHPSGHPAVSAAALDQFLAEGRAWLTWADQPTRNPDLLPLGEGTGPAAAATEAAAAKLEQYFLLCDAVALDPSVSERDWIGAEADLLDAAIAAAVLEKAPLARPRADGVLDLGGPVNPVWRDRLTAYADRAVRLIVGARTTLDRAAVAAVRAKLAPFGEWTAARPNTQVAGPGIDVLRVHVTDDTLAERVRELLAESESAAVALDGVKLVEKAILFQANLLRLTNNLVAMPELFDPDRHAAFERGALVMDGRVFRLSIPVLDAARAERFASMSPIYVLFVRIGPKGRHLDQEVMVPVTAGECGHLTEGMWGVFHKPDGTIEHAQVRKITVAPISIREALLAPFMRLGETVQSMFDAAAAGQQASAKAAMDAQAQTAVETTSHGAEAAVAAGGSASAPPPVALPAPKPAPVAAAPSGSAFGQLPLLVAGAGVALGAIGTVFVQAMDLFMTASGALAQALIALPFMDALPAGAQSALSVGALPVAILLVLLGLFIVPALTYAIPVAASAWLRLRRRDLATLLEGAGWAVNTRLYLDRPLAIRLTRRPPRT